MNANIREKGAASNAQPTISRTIVTKIVALRPKSSEDGDRNGQILPSAVLFGVSFPRHSCGPSHSPTGLVRWRGKLVCVKEL